MSQKCVKVHGKDHDSQGEGILLAVNNRVTCEVLDTSVDIETIASIANCINS